MFPKKLDDTKTHASGLTTRILQMDVMTVGHVVSGFELLPPRRQREMLRSLNGLATKAGMTGSQESAHALCLEIVTLRLPIIAALVSDRPKDPPYPFLFLCTPHQPQGMAVYTCESNKYGHRESELVDIGQFSERLRAVFEHLHTLKSGARANTPIPVGDLLCPMDGRLWFAEHNKSLGIFEEVVDHTRSPCDAVRMYVSMPTKLSRKPVAAHGFTLFGHFPASPPDVGGYFPASPPDVGVFFLPDCETVSEAKAMIWAKHPDWKVVGWAKGKVHSKNFH